MKPVSGTGGSSPRRAASAVLKSSTVCCAGVDLKSCGSSFSWKSTETNQSSSRNSLAAGKRVGDAMLAGQRELADDTFRGRVFGEGELRLHDWFVPVLFQEKEDPQLFKTTPAKQTVADFQTALKARLGELPPVDRKSVV